MEKSSTQFKERGSMGELAVEGLFAGIAAGLVMLLYLMVSGILSGEAASVMPGRFSIQVPPNPLQGALLHLAVSGIYGMLFGIIWRFVGGRISCWLAAVLYALAIYLLAIFVLLPGTGTPLLEIAPLHFALAHLVYGLGLGLWFRSK
jgi:hypothetical protein